MQVHQLVSWRSLGLSVLCGVLSTRPAPAQLVTYQACYVQHLGALYLIGQPGLATRLSRRESPDHLDQRLRGDPHRYGRRGGSERHVSEPHRRALAGHAGGEHGADERPGAHLQRHRLGASGQHKLSHGCSGRRSRRHLPEPDGGAVAGHDEHDLRLHRDRDIWQRSNPPRDDPGRGGNPADVVSGLVRVPCPVRH